MNIIKKIIKNLQEDMKKVDEEDKRMTAKRTDEDGVYHDWKEEEEKNE